MTVTELCTVAVSATTVVGGITTWINWIISRRQIKRALGEATTGFMQVLIAEGLQREIEKHSPERYTTLKMHFPNGHWIAAPIITGVPLQCYENITITGTSHNEQETIATLVCRGFGHISQHSHDQDETIRVMSGFMVCLATGRRYVAGEEWHVPAEEVHGAYFQDAVCILRYIPRLPLASEQPVALSSMGQCFSPATQH